MTNKEKSFTAVEVRVLNVCRPNNHTVPTFYRVSEHRAMDKLVKEGLLRAYQSIGRQGKEMYYCTTKLGKVLLKKYLSRQ